MWNPPDAEFYIPQMPVALVNLDGSGAVDRSLFEQLRCVVLCHAPGTPLDFLRVLGQGEMAPRYMIISGHGTPEGLWFGTYGKSVDARQHDMLVGEYLPPSVIAQHVNLPGCTILSASCHGGATDLAKAYLAGGVSAYIGPRKAVGFALSVFCMHFFFCVIEKRMSDRDAWEAAVRATDHDDIWSVSYYHADGREEQLMATGMGASR